MPHHTESSIGSSAAACLSSLTEYAATNLLNLASLPSFDAGHAPFCCGGLTGSTFQIISAYSSIHLFTKHQHSH